MTARKPHVHVDSERLLDALREVGQGELDDFADHFDISPASARRKLDGLVARGFAQRLPSSGRGPIYIDVDYDPGVGDHPDADRPPGTSGSWGEA